MSRLLPSNLAHHRGPLRSLALGLNALDTLAGWAIIVMLGVMVAVVSLQVLLRYALNSSLGFADELSRLTFVWSIFLGIPLGIRLGAHIGRDRLQSRKLVLREPSARLLPRLHAAPAFPGGGARRLHRQRGPRSSSRGSNRPARLRLPGGCGPARCAGLALPRLPRRRSGGAGGSRGRPGGLG